MKVSLLERLLSSRRGRLKNLKNNVLSYLSQLPEKVISDEQKQVLSYLKQNDIAVFPYPFIEDYNSLDVEVNYDDEVKLVYTLFEGKKLYYKDGNQKKAKRYFKAILIEQDKSSPHRYLSADFDVSKNDMVADVGAAEGNFSLSIIEKAKHVYLFEPDTNWAKALESTFLPWKDKVTIVNQFVSHKTDEQNQTVCLDDYFNNNQALNFIKADVEGAEIDVLHGSKNILDSSRQLKIAICTYHNQDDAERIEVIIKSHGFSHKFSPGYMLYYYGRSNVVKEPYLRKAILRAEKSL
jgi:hypothetical protein